MGTLAAAASVRKRLRVAKEIYLAELDLELTKGLAYGWREDASTRLSEIRANIPTALEKIQTSIRTFFKELTSQEGAALPEWVYKSTGGALEEVLLSLEKRMKEEDGAFQTAVLQISVSPDADS